ncbi:6-phosphofructokinase 1 [Mycoplasmoides fastidiosum]|uniref:6-phosphofructokinase n=1 Tax=Mycoplasmoides fastidiosum TaxID=92758 RepID=A0ABU0LZK3_9BACT|nr:ATP-dependent 6-phosphofructokinase [Mycoplasmoides fastidiosum]MDQ0514033.1 6-phosphofructokinase 1 [Mycoplasmoides fastidiosum]UUD37557.1 ATP-dependent 6-phosphofructokinase [Mycoplasmoides fastidiosum]
MNSPTKKRVAVLTSGGDSPGMNATIYGFVASAINAGLEPYIVVDGYDGLIDNHIFPISYNKARQHAHDAGTFIGSARSMRYKNDPTMRQLAKKNLEKNKISGLLVIGGDGSYQGAQLLHELKFPVLAAPGTVDNDVGSSIVTVGFNSAAQVIFDCLKTIKKTAISHRSVFLIEAMGRHCVDLSVIAGIAGIADAIITAENPFNTQDFIEYVKKAEARGQRGVIFLVTEKVYGKEYSDQLDDLNVIAKAIEKATDRTTRYQVIGYLQRGATPTATDVLLGIGFGNQAIQLFLENKVGYALGSNGWDYYETELAIANQLKPADRTKMMEWNNKLININETKPVITATDNPTKK